MITKDNKFRVMELFFKYPGRTFYIRELARLTNLSSTGIIKIVRKLKDEKLLISKKGKVIEEIKPNFEWKFLLVKRLYNIYSLYESGLMEFIKRHYERPKAIMLFGSYSEGSDIEKSDIDIAIIGSNKEAPELDKYEKRLSRKISIHKVDLSRSSNEFKNSLANGMTLEGFAEIIG